MAVLTAAFKMLLMALSVTAAIVLMIAVLPIHKKLLWPVIALYAIAILYITLFSRVAAEEGRGIYLFPFRFVYWIVQYAKGLTYHGVFRPILGVYMNILMFVPFGFFFKFARESTVTWKIILVGFCSSLIIELAQMIFHLGMFETDDLMTNTLGTWLGTVLCRRRMQKT